MERRVLLAAVLSGVVIILWFSLFAPPRPATGPAAAPPVVGSTPVGRPGAPPAPVATPRPEVPTLPAVVGQDAGEIALDGEGWHGLVSPKGGVLTSLILSEYKDGAGAPLELVRPGVYRVKAQKALEPGEYGFLYAIAGAGSGGAAAARIFDFSVKM